MSDEPITLDDLVRRYGAAMPLTAHAAVFGQADAVACLRVTHARTLGEQYAHALSVSQRPYDRGVDWKAYAWRVAHGKLGESEGAPAELLALDVGLARFAEISGVSETEHARAWFVAFDRGFVDAFEVRS